MKKCPFCAEQIQDEAIKCRYCGSLLAAPGPERVVLRINPSFKPILAMYAGAAAVTLAALALLLLVGFPLAAAPVALATFGYAGVFHLQRNRTHYILTTQNLTIETGILAKEATHIPLSKIQDVTVRRSLLDRLFNIGTIVVDSAGSTGRIPEIHVDSPNEVSRRILAEAGLAGGAGA